MLLQIGSGQALWLRCQCQCSVFGQEQHNDGDVGQATGMCKVQLQNDQLGVTLANKSMQTKSTNG